MRIVFDLDGTLADDEHRQHHLLADPQRWDEYYSECARDRVVEAAAEVFRALAPRHWLSIWTGRRADYWDDTMDWLIRNIDGARTRKSLGGVDLKMRPVGDRTPAAELKRLWLDNARGSGLSVDLAFDDASPVVAMWREEGVPCFQVAPGPF